jgi:hypothetical protein
VHTLHTLTNSPFMKKFLVFSILLLAFHVIHAQNKYLKDVIGKWQMAGNFGTLEFLDSTNVITTMNGRKVSSGTYTIDFTKTPFWLDVTVKQGGRSFTFKQILEFTDDNTIRWQTSTTLDRPKAFEQTPYGGPLVLTRAQ